MTATYLICGKVGSGKTTFSRSLEREEAAIHLSLDDWMIHLYGHEMERELFEERVQRCIDRFIAIAAQLQRHNVGAILDCGFWRREARRTTTARLEARGLRPVLYYLDVPAAVRWERIHTRNQGPASSEFEITREMFESFDEQFEEPSEDEHPIVVRRPREPSTTHGV